MEKINLLRMSDAYFRKFSEILDKSIEKHKNANKPITVGHLSNMAKLAMKLVDNREKLTQQMMDEAFMDSMEREHQFGD